MTCYEPATLSIASAWKSSRPSQKVEHQYPLGWNMSPATELGELSARAAAIKGSTRANRLVH